MSLLLLIMVFFRWFVFQRGTYRQKDFPGGSDGKASACNVGNPGSIPGWGRSSRKGKWHPTPVLVPGKSYGRRSLVGCSPWCRQESDTTERLHFASLHTEKGFLHSVFDNELVSVFVKCIRYITMLNFLGRSFHVPLGHLYVFLGEMSVQVF